MISPMLGEFFRIGGYQADIPSDILPVIVTDDMRYGPSRPFNSGTIFTVLSASVGNWSTVFLGVDPKAPSTARCCIDRIWVKTGTSDRFNWQLETAILAGNNGGASVDSSKGNRVGGFAITGGGQLTKTVPLQSTSTQSTQKAGAGGQYPSVAGSWFELRDLRFVLIPGVVLVLETLVQNEALSLVIEYKYYEG
jgi:hypothetical protein